MKGAKEFKEAMKNGLAEEFKSFAAGRKPKDEKAAAALVVEFAKLHGYDVSASAADASKNGHVLCDDQLSMAAGGQNATAIAGADGKGMSVFADNKDVSGYIVISDGKKESNIFSASDHEKEANLFILG